MSDVSILREFLVAVGFKVDGAQYKKMEASLKKVIKAVEAVGAAVAVAVAAVKVGVEDMAQELEELYFASQRIGSSVQDIKAFGYAVSQMGGNAKAAQASLENLAEAIRSNPSMEGLLNGMGVRTREGNGDLRGRVEIMRDLARQLQGMDYRIAKQRAAQLGVDTNTLQAMRRGDLDGYMSKYGDMAKSADLDKAAAGAHDFMIAMRELGAQFELVGFIVAARWAPVIKVVVGLLSSLGAIMQKLDKWTDGWSTRLVSLTAVIAGMVAAAGFVTGGLEGVGAAFVVVAGVIGAPIALIIAAVAGLAVAGYEIYKHWNTIGPFFEKTWDRMAKAAEEGARRIKAAAAAIGRGDMAGAGRALTTPSAPQVAPSAAPAPSAGSGTVGGRIQQAIAFFRAQGWTREQSTGIVANLLGENDTLDPTRRERRRDGSVGPGYGIGQWTNGKRKALFKSWFGHDLTTSTFGEQLAFFQRELTSTEGKAGVAIRKARTAAQAAMAAVGAERPDDFAGAMRKRADIADRLSAGTYRPAGLQLVSFSQQTDIHITGGDARETGRAVASEQGRVNGNLVRSLKGGVR